ncbi:MAG: ABC transporter ATP-binding protein, partial [Micromonosporaceae bacterium]|nr:ABC transporter ATP-binding protein [Micromonosporaceae bacterium]
MSGTHRSVDPAVVHPAVEVPAVEVPAVEVQDVRVALDGVPVLRGVGVSVAAGEWVTIIGPNGAGKSTLLRAIGGLVTFTGQIRLHGVPLAQFSRRERARLVAIVPQNPEIPPGMAVLDYALLGRTPYIRSLGRESAVDIEVVERVLARLDLLPFADRPLETLSGGERQRAFLARALAQGVRSGPAGGPDHGQILLLDEPTSALDIGHQQDVLDLVDELRGTERLTVVSTMHDLSIAGEYADRLVLLAGGRVVATGTPDEVLTEETLMAHYGARVRVTRGEHGPLVVPVRTRTRP